MSKTLTIIITTLALLAAATTTAAAESYSVSVAPVAPPPCGSDGWPNCDTVEHDYLIEWGKGWATTNGNGNPPYAKQWAAVCKALWLDGLMLPSGWCPSATT